ncbi:uncharacterized protein [Palaemon carinicauda]|uniref:uncharacterized protein n=1 Tax=Palaemon carinicauda TaxID=392227 RepID=UPI0035B5ACDD
MASRDILAEQLEEPTEQGPFSDVGAHSVDAAHAHSVGGVLERVASPSPTISSPHYYPQKRDEYYEELQSVIAETLERDMKIMIGDFNAKAGRNNQGMEILMCVKGLGEVANQNGAHFKSFCSVNNIVIGGTLFQHKTIHEYTWTSPCGNYKNQIDHIANNKSLRDEEQTINEEWRDIKIKYQAVGREVLGRTVTRRKPWIWNNICDIIERRQRQKLIVESVVGSNENYKVEHAKYSVIDLDVKRKARNDWRKYSNSKEDEADTAMDSGNGYGV